MDPELIDWLKESKRHEFAVRYDRETMSLLLTLCDGAIMASIHVVLSKGDDAEFMKHAQVILLQKWRNRRLEKARDGRALKTRF